MEGRVVPAGEPANKLRRSPRSCDTRYPERGHPHLLDRLTKTERAKLLAICSRRRLAIGENLFAQSDNMDELFVLLSGRVRVYYISEHGNQLTFAYWTAGTLVGTPAIYREFKHLWNADAVEPSELLAAPCDDFTALLTTVPSLAVGVIEALEFKAKRLGNLSQILATSSVAKRLQLLLLNLIDLYGKNHDGTAVLTVPFTHEEIAGMVSASRPWVSSMLAQLKRSGLLSYSGRLMAFRAPERLRSLDFERMLKNGDRTHSRLIVT